MNQTVTANISGIIYHIDVDAYEQLKAYLNKIRSYFKDAEESKEIMTDIEARIAELFNSNISNENQVISEKNVKDMIDIMGRPEQYFDEEEKTSQDQDKGSDKFKSETNDFKSPRRLFRDPDDRVLGGVASGIGAYLGIDPVWLRLFFIIMLFMGFGFLFYIILWIIIPEARTAAEKLQMKGAPVNIENIGKSFEEGANKVNEKISNLNKGRFGKNLESFLHSVFSVLGTLLKGLFKVFGKLLGFAFVIFGIFFAIIFIGSLLSSDVVYAFTSNGIFSFESYDFFGTLFTSELQYNIASYGLMLVLGIPIIALLLGGIRLLFNIKGNFGIGVALAILWTVGLVACTLISIQLATEFKSNSEIIEEINVNGEFEQVIISMDEENIPGNQVINIEGDDFFITMDDEKIYYGYPILNIEKSKSDRAYVEVAKLSHGGSKKKAIDNARSIEYYIIQDENLLSFSPCIEISKKNRIRGQQVEMTLYIPEKMVIYLDPSIENLIYDIKNVTDTHDSDMLGENWIMLEDGLTCLDCEDINGVSADELEY